MNEIEKKPEEQLEATEEKKPGNAITKLYDKLPFTFKQVDLFVKILIGLMIALIIFGIWKGNQ